MQPQKFLHILTAVVTTILLSLTVASTARAAEYKVLYKFAKAPDATNSYSGLTFDAAGNLYGISGVGGIYGYGTVYKLTPNPDGSWTESIVFNFGGADGINPSGGLTFDPAGNLYGVTDSGGARDLGTVFRLTPNPDGSWTHTVLHNFEGYWNDGLLPRGQVILDGAGNVYGTTNLGGAHNYGTVFRLTANPDGSWTQSLLHSFSGVGIDSGWPEVGVIFDAAGNLYGTTPWGGVLGSGTAFQLTPNPDGTWTHHVIFSFGTHAVYPHGLIFDAVGNLYGTTEYGGAHGLGTAFKLTPNPDGSWTKSTVHAFRGPTGGQPGSGLTLDVAGNLYGTTKYGGPFVGGTVFKLTRKPDDKWGLTNLHAFQRHHPECRLLMDVAGNLYGTTPQGGKGCGEYGCGLVFMITP